MRVLVFSDIHGNSIALEGLINMLPEIAFDKIVFLGDIWGYYYNQEECIRMLKNIPDLIWLKGNHDVYAKKAFYCRGVEENLIRTYGHSYDLLRERFSEDTITIIDSLPPCYECTILGKRIGFFHGRPSNPLEGRIYDDTDVPEEEVEGFDILFFGHTHCKIDRTVATTRILSPGSLGQPRDGKGYGFLIYDFVKGECDFMNITMDNNLLRDRIDRNDKGMKKLYDVLKREM